MAELKPCPFCGGTDIEINVMYDNTKRCYLKCRGCRIEQKLYENKNMAIEAWNTRAKESKRE